MTDLSEKKKEMDSNEIADYFKCTKCGKYLKPPIAQCVQGHITCNECNNSRDKCPQCDAQYSPVLRILGQIANSVQFQCPFQTSGCKKNLKWNEIGIHEADCDYRIHNCPQEGCVWKGPNNKLREHFLDDHKSLSLVAPGNTAHFASGNTVYFDVDLSTSYHKILLVVALHCNFFLHLIRTEKASYTTVILQLVGTKKRSEKYYFALEIQTSDSKPTFKVEGPVESNSFDGFKTTKKVGLFDSVFKNSRNRCKLVLNKKLFECPVCLETRSSPIYICFNGHSLCSDCKIKLTECPSCKVTLGNARNYALERILSDQVDEVADSKAAIYQCPFESTECAWTGTVNEIVPHVKQTHFNRVVRNGGSAKLYDYPKVLIDASGKPFVYEETTRGDFTYAMVQSYDASQRYRYTAEFPDGCIYMGKCTDGLVPLEQLIDSGISGMSRRNRSDDERTAKIFIEPIQLD